MKIQTIDIETTGLSPYEGAEIFAFCIGDYDCKNVEVLRLDSPYPRVNRKNKKRLQEFFDDTSIKKLAHNFQFEYTHLRYKDFINIPEETVWEDSMLMSQCLRNNAPSHELAHLCWELSGWTTELDTLVKRLGKEYGGYHKIPKAIMHTYQISDGIRPMLLYRTFIKSLRRDPPLLKDYRIEIETKKVTSRIEEHGFKISSENCYELIDKLENEIELVEKETYSLLGEWIGFTDTQVARILYSQMKLPVIKETKGKKPSVDKEVLVHFREITKEPIFDLILKHRSYTVGVTNIQSYLKHAKNEYVIHPNINSNRAVTSRQSCSYPNMQNIAKEENLKNPFPIPARRCFCNFKDCVLLFCDYDGQELRLIIEYTAEQEMIEMLSKGEKVHNVMAKLWYGDRYRDKKQDPTLYDSGKNATFARAYGAGIEKITKTLLLSSDTAKEGWDRVQTRFPNFCQYSSMVTDDVRDVGFVKTAFGRKLFLPSDKAYIGANYYIQGTAAGMMKRAEVNVDKYLRECWKDEIRMILVIHDELVFSFPRKLLSKLKLIISGINTEMVNIPELSVPLELGWKISTTTWDRAKSLEL